MNQSQNLSISLFGYNRQQVDLLVQQQKDRLARLESQQEENQQRITDLESQLAYYQEIEKDLTDGVLDARKAGNKIVAESNDAAENLINQTNQQVSQYKEDVAHYSRQLTASGTSLKHQLNEMKMEMENILRQYQTMIEATDFDRLFPEEKMEQFSSQIDEYMNDDLTSNRSGSRLKWQDSSNMTDEEKKELERLIHEVIANESKPGSSTEETTENVKTDKLVRLVSNKMN
ncbi:DivIVA domain-containing protein [Fundicoccus culcitae]|uniref:DivIVA domain-containing protein n=1 Tax=Fundicoccus culcitae TaxID=2969821 RepID=A0ABY5P6Y0_9LACT|nr:DivIVA domain-containing protein [Fundicoccus culcitae]UUX34188.1 DivIVA domain-containing protein [Fundicoccus culcitae]